MCPLRPKSFVRRSSPNDWLAGTKRRAMPIHSTITFYFKASCIRPASNFTEGLQTKRMLQTRLSGIFSNKHTLNVYLQ